MSFYVVIFKPAWSVKAATSKATFKEEREPAGEHSAIKRVIHIAGHRLPMYNVHV